MSCFFILTHTLPQCSTYSPKFDCFIDGMPSVASTVSVWSGTTITLQAKMVYELVPASLVSFLAFIVPLSIMYLHEHSILFSFSASGKKEVPLSSPQAKLFQDDLPDHLHPPWQSRHLPHRCPTALYGSLILYLSLSQKTGPFVTVSPTPCSWLGVPESSLTFQVMDCLTGLSPFLLQCLNRNYLPPCLREVSKKRMIQELNSGPAPEITQEASLRWSWGNEEGEPWLGSSCFRVAFRGCCDVRKSGGLRKTC